MGREQRTSGQGAEARLLTRDEARRIAVNVLSTHMADIDIALR
jgi:hypothetical protein